MSSYISIDYDGNYDSLLQFLQDKNWTFEEKRAEKQKAYFKIPKENLEEIQSISQGLLVNCHLLVKYSFCSFIRVSARFLTPQLSSE